MVNPQKPPKPIISFSVDPALKEKLQKFAAEDQRSLAQYIQIVLKDHIEHRKSSGKPADKRK
jgi:hypothetical protein